ncbi:MAG: lipopolysaccharide kinase InaA family protein [Desulfobacterales bacterium]
MKPNLKLPVGSGDLVGPHKIDTDKIIKAEAKCLIWSEQLKDATPAIFKMYYRRGIANFIRGKIITFRAQREFRILRHLDRKGIPCSIPLFWTCGYCKEYGFYEILCTRQIPNAISLKAFLASKSIFIKDVDLESLFQTVCNMHRCGVYHGAFSTKNILINATGKAPTKFYIIDLARGWLFPSSILGKKIAWHDLLKLIRNCESDLGIGYCQPYLAQYGLGQGAIQQFYQDARPYQSYSRKHKRIKNILKVKVFFHVILTQLNQRVH